MIVLNPVLDSLCNLGLKNIGLHPGVNFEWFPGPQDAVIILGNKTRLILQTEKIQRRSFHTK